MIHELQKLLVIVGPTASGKTRLSLEIAKKYNGYIISADAFQIYKELNIGTGKVTPEEQDNIPHFGIDIIEPNESFTVAEYKKYAEEIITEHKGVPILVGGTGLYVDAITKNLKFPEVPPNQALRNKLENKLKEQGVESLQNELLQEDPQAEKIVDLKNPRRVMRALEVIHETNKPFSDFYKTGPQKYTTTFIGLNPPKEELHKNIETRVDQMITNGLLQETETIINKYGANIQALQAIGYKQLLPYFNNKITKEQAIKDIKQATKKYAKRQLTWFKKNKNIQWLENQNAIIELLK